MNLYLISAHTEGWDVYDSAVVAAPDEESARKTHPNGRNGPQDWGGFGSTWAARWEHVSAKLIGKAVKGTPAGVICASFNAG